MDDFSKVCVLFCWVFKTRGPHRPFLGVLLLAAVLSSCTGSAASVDSVPKIVASAGETVLLPCYTTASDHVPTVEWTKQSSRSVIAFLYRDGCETFDMKDPVFRYRTNLIIHKLHHGNLSMLMSNVQTNDSGRYQCAIPSKKKQVIATLELFVGAASEPRLSVVPGVGGGLTLQCEARCWFPEPLITLFDNQGNEMSAEDPRRHEDSSKCFTVIRRVTVHTATNRVTCRVHQPEINQTRHSEIYIPDEYLRSCPVITITAVFVSVLVVCIVIAIAFLVRRDYFCAERQRVRLNNEDKDTTGLTTEQSNHRSKPGQIQQPRQSANEPKSSPGTSKREIPPPPKSPYISNPPKPSPSPNRSYPQSVGFGQNPASMKQSSHRGSSAAPTSDGAAPSVPPPDPKEKPLSRSMSVSEKRVGGARTQRRNTFSVPTNNPFSVLSELSEDSEDAKPLI